jgi:hypothetical protein
MPPRLLAAALALASGLASTPALADPFYLPPFLDRTPALGDRWLYAAYNFLGDLAGEVTIEVVAVDETDDGWRFLVEDQLEFLPELGVPAGPVHRHEWFCDADGTISRGDWWIDGVLVVDVTKPLRVIGDGRRFEHLGWPKAVKRRGRISQLLLPGARPPLFVELRLGDRTHPTLEAGYDDATVGRVVWTNRSGLNRRLVSAVIDGVEWESPFIPPP